ncbi:MAG: polysaccharide deacetylase family protein [Burkholderiaceae bacterium]
MRALRKVKSHVRDVAGEGLRMAGLTSPTLWARGKLSVVTFHRVLPPSLLAKYPIPGIAVTPDELDHFLRVFQKHYTVGPLSEMARRHGNGDVPAKPLLAVTFDDGQLDNFLFARPVLQARGVRASFYVVSDAADANRMLWPDRMAFAVRSAMEAGDIGLASWLDDMGVTADAADLPLAAVTQAKNLTPGERNRRLDELELLVGDRARPEWDGMMNWQQLRTLRIEGHEIGSHSASHPILPLVDDADLAHEVRSSKNHIEAQIGHEVRSFCYPNGDHDERVIEQVRRAGYDNAVTTRYGLNDGDASPYDLRRVDLQGRYGRNVKGQFSSGSLLIRMAGLLPGMA